MHNVSGRNLIFPECVVDTKNSFLKHKVYRKQTHTNRYLNAMSHHYQVQKGAFHRAEKRMLILHGPKWHIHEKKKNIWWGKSSNQNRYSDVSTSKALVKINSTSKYESIPFTHWRSNSMHWWHVTEEKLLAKGIYQALWVWKVLHREISWSVKNHIKEHEQHIQL